MLFRSAVPVFYGVQPQSDDGQPSQMPVVIINRVSSTWIGAFCGTDTDMAVTGIQVDYYDETAEGARRLADGGRMSIRDLVGDSAGGGILESEISYYDDDSRGWRVLQRWSLTDYVPQLS